MNRRCVAILSVLLPILTYIGISVHDYFWHFRR